VETGDGLDYHRRELEIALDPSRPEHSLPDVSGVHVGVVDVGCGIGQLFVAKGDELAAEVTRWGFDVDPRAVAYALAHWPERARFEVAPAEALPLPDRAVDLYVARLSLPYADLPAALREAARVLVAGGRLWIALHPSSLVLAELGAALLRGRLKEALRQAIVFANGLEFRLSGRDRKRFGVRASWQSEALLRRLLAPDFTDLRIVSGRCLIVEATRRG